MSGADKLVRWGSHLATVASDFHCPRSFELGWDPACIERELAELAPLTGSERVRGRRRLGDVLTLD